MRDSAFAGRCLVAFALMFPTGCAAAGLPSIVPSTLPPIARVDERFQSYNIEMVEITGGRFWRPYRLAQDNPPGGAEVDTPEAKDARLFQYRRPIDLTSARLRLLAAAIGPAYIRVSGSWANSTYFADQDDVSGRPPPGFKGILTKPEWRAVVDFALRVHGRIVTSFAVSADSRDAAGAWTTDRARRLLAYTRAIGGSIAAAEFINEPDLAAIGGLPTDYDAAAYGRDFKLFHSVLKRASPETMILGPAAVSEGATIAPLVAASAAGLDAFSYHYYGALSERCSGKNAPEAALLEDTLSGTDRALAFNKNLRDQFAPGRPIWLTETADAACGGNPWAVTFLDTFRYLDQLGRLAKAGVKVVMHNTLAASDYGLLDESTLRPRPKYWGALLWRRLMGTTVLEAGIPIQAGLHVYAHCQRGRRGGVSLLVINTDRTATRRLMVASAALRYTLGATELTDAGIRLNGRTLDLKAGGELPDIEGTAMSAGIATFDPATITFLAIPGANNGACRRVSSQVP